MEIFEIKDGCLIKCNLPSEIAHVVSRRIKKIGPDAFSYCHQLERLYIPWYVEEVSETNFVDRTGVFKEMLQSPNFTIFGEKGTVAERVAMKAGVNFKECTEIIKGDRYCYYFGKTDSVIIPVGIKCIGAICFTNARHVKNVVIPNGVEYIYSNAFRKTLIENIVLPESVKALDGNVFNGCKNLKEVIFENGETKIDNDCFTLCHENLVIKAPAGGFVEEYAKQYNLKFEAL